MKKSALIPGGGNNIARELASDVRSRKKYSIVKAVAGLQLLLLLVAFSILPNCLSAQQWQLIGTLSLSKTNFEVRQIAPDLALVFGGNLTGSACFPNPTNTCDIIDVRNRSVRRAAPMLNARSEFASVVSSDTTVYAISGQSNDANRNLTPTVERYNRSSGRWELVGNLIQPRRQHAAVLVDDRYIIVIGGRDDNLSTLNSAEIFDISTGVSRAIRDYPLRVNNPGAVLNSQQVPWFFGGRAGNQFSAQSRDLHEYSVQTDQWIKVGEIGVDTETFTLLKLFDGRVCVSGGLNQRQQANREIILERGAGIPFFASLANGLMTHGVGQVDDSTLIVFGGSAYSTSTGHLINQACEYVSLVNGTRMAAPRMNEPRRLLKSVTIPKVCVRGGRQTNVVVAIGGLDSRGTSATVEMIEFASVCVALKPPQIQLAGADCNYEDVEITDEIGIQLVELVGSSSRNVYVEPVQGLLTLRARVRVRTTEPNQPGEYVIRAVDSDGNEVFYSGRINPIPSLRFVDASQPLGLRNDGRSGLVCGPVEVENPTSQPLTISSAYLTSGREFSIPQAQLPITIGPGERRRLTICHERRASGVSWDTLTIEGSCVDIIRHVDASSEFVEEFSSQSRCDIQVFGSLERGARKVRIVSAQPVPTVSSVRVRLIAPFDMSIKDLGVSLVDASGYKYTPPFSANLSSPGTFEVDTDMSAMPPGVYRLVLQTQVGAVATTVVRVE